MLKCGECGHLHKDCLKKNEKHDGKQGVKGHSVTTPARPTAPDGMVEAHEKAINIY